MPLADTCIYVAGVIPLADALAWGSVGLIGMGVFSFGLGAWWAGR